MQVHQIKRPRNLKKANRVGRGGKRGTYSGRGMKGQKSRAGARIRPQILDYIFKIPKFSGPTQKREDAGRGSKAQGSQWKEPVFIVNIEDLNKVTKSGDIVNTKFLMEKKLVKSFKGQSPKHVKILGNGELKKKIMVEGLRVSKSAKEKIEKAGGSIKS